MKIGILTNALAEQGARENAKESISLSGIADWACANGFEDLECGPSLRIDRGEFEKVLAEKKISITALIYCRNYLSTDEKEAVNHREELKKRICFAGELGIEKVITSTGIDKQIEEGIYDRDESESDRGNLIRRIPIRSLNRVVELFSPIVELAEKKSVKLCFENCPLMGNIAISPEMWHLLFERLGSKNVGLAYDPSHLVWEMIDPYAPIEEFADRIFHVHAKDTQINRKRLARTGILTDFSWWQYRIPGRGELDWEKIIRLLKKINYTGTVSLELEDDEYAGSLNKIREGLIAGRNILKKSGCV